MVTDVLGAGLALVRLRPGFGLLLLTSLLRMSQIQPQGQQEVLRLGWALLELGLKNGIR